MKLKLVEPAGVMICTGPVTAPRGTSTWICDKEMRPEAIDAAVQGRGVMLGLLPLIWDVKNAGHLTSTFGLAPQEAGAYFVICRNEDRANPIIRSFIEWLISELRPDVRRLMHVERERLKVADG